MYKIETYCSNAVLQIKGSVGWRRNLFWNNAVSYWGVILIELIDGYVICYRNDSDDDVEEDAASASLRQLAVQLNLTAPSSQVELHLSRQSKLFGLFSQFEQNIYRITIILSASMSQYATLSTDS